MGKDTNITMEVDTKNINEHNVDEHVYFRDDRDNKDKGRPKNFTTRIEKGGKVFWYGKASPETSGIIHITEIGRKSLNGEVELLDDQPKHSKDENAFVAKVKDHYIKGQENYYVKFKINNSGPTYEVDPKLEMIQV